jgi:hypothetical protein
LPLFIVILAKCLKIAATKAMAKDRIIYIVPLKFVSGWSLGVVIMLQKRQQAISVHVQADMWPT